METINYIDTLLNKQSNYDESTDAIVPDMYPYISKILGVTACAYIKDTTLQNNRILISGDIKCEICYIPDDLSNPIRMQYWLSFAHIEDINVQECMVNSTICLNKIDAKIINPRKISIFANIQINTKAYTEKNIVLPINSQDNEFEVLPIERTLTLIDSLNISDMTIADDFEFKEIIAEEYELFGLKPSIVITDTKVLKNKLMLRGNIEFKGGVIAQDEISEISTNVPFSHILDIDINDESLETEIEISIKSCDVENNGDDFSYVINAKACVIQNKEEKIMLVSDIYDVKNDLLITKKEYKIINTPKYEYEKSDFNILIKSAEIIDSIVYMNGFAYTKMTEQNKYDCYVCINAIYKSKDGYYSVSEDYMFASGIECSFIECKNISIFKNSNTEIDLRVTLDMYKYNHQKITFDIIEQIERGNTKTVENNTIILKYINTETNLWDIAKEYNTTSEDIICSNNLDANLKTICNKMLLIPVK